MKPFKKLEQDARARFGVPSPFAYASEVQAMDDMPAQGEGVLASSTITDLLADAVGMERESALLDLRGEEKIGGRYRRCAAALRLYAHQRFDEAAK